MYRVAILLVIITTVAMALTGCVNLLEGFDESVTEHPARPYIRQPTEQITVSGYDELVATIISLIMEHETEMQLLYYHDDGEDVHAEIQRASDEILLGHPIGAYAVAGITAEATIIVSYYEVDIVIEYKRTQEQLDSIINVSSERYMRTQLLNIMSEYREEAIIQTNLQFTDDDITGFVSEIYYQNPRSIVMLPFVTVETFPEEGVDRIYEIKFGNTDSTGMLQRFSRELELYVQGNAELAVGDTDSEILLFLANSLIVSTTFDEGMARTIHAHGPQNFAATAFGALVRGSAVGEGFAMAFKALADEMGINCRIVLGHYDGIVHAWNIVSLYGDFYHIDVAMSAVNGIETAFLKSDIDFEEMLYTWDRENTVRCEGLLTIDDVLVPDEPDDLDDLDDPDGPDNLDNPNDFDNQNDEPNEDEEG